ncbi:hypothetical protein LPB140_00640 [Sphingorhabdus lutea]|uniref:SCO family protein n=1 Tax=Sphingorhabdus lutea TaxID=1913578 RepID=A0A1L3J8Y0_9SPHN|nr:SCO family protein [Sphingorhabdus lutea]APG61596.1 hypothetical protein LPB140_00640 [Sphingorhabdus lutea]
MNKQKFLLTALSLSLAAPFITSCGEGTMADEKQAMESSIAGAKIGGAFTLTNQDGGKTSYSDFDGKYRLIYFGYTNCPDICSPDTQNLMAGLKMLENQAPEKAALIQPIFVTVDPQRDTPKVLKEFVSAFHPRLIGLTGSEAEIADAAKKFVVVYNKVEGSSPENYLMGHSQTALLMGKKGEPIALISLDNPNTQENEGDPAKVFAELNNWVVAP